MKPILLIALSMAASAAYAQTNNDLPQSDKCFNVPVTVAGETKEVTVTPATAINSDRVYVYCHKRKVRHHYTNEFADLPDANASRPILLREKMVTKVLPENYRVTLSTPQSTVTACPDSNLNLSANINVEQESSFTGNYPTSLKKNNYILLSRKQYRKVERKLARIDRKERKVARATGVTPRQA